VLNKTEKDTIFVKQKRVGGTQDHSTRFKKVSEYVVVFFGEFHDLCVEVFPSVFNCHHFGFHVCSLLSLLAICRHKRVSAIVSSFHEMFSNLSGLNPNT
jgi:hypothetical protein